MMHLLKPWLESVIIRPSRLARVGLIAVVLILTGASLWIFGALRTADLLRSDPDNLLLHRNLMAFGITRGKSVFLTHCASCHGAGAKGDALLGVPDLTDQDWIYGNGQISEIQLTVDYGIRAQDARGRDLAEMPAFARPVPYTREKLLPLSPNDVRDIVEFLLLLDKKPANKIAAARGQLIYSTRGGCWDCHGNDARGDSEVGAPNLTDNIWLYGHGSRADISDSIENGRAGICPAWINRLSSAAIVEISLYVYSLSHPNPDGNHG